MIAVKDQGFSASPAPVSFSSLFEEDDARYRVRYNVMDDDRQHEYQLLRAEIFVHQKGWNIPLDAQGRERDRYDHCNATVHVHCVYGVAECEYLLAGIRVLTLGTWADSMVVNEFSDAGMISEEIVQLLQCQNCTQFLELTRFCVQRGRWSFVPHGRFNHQIARDLTYATAYFQALQTGRTRALALVDADYLKVMKRSHFVFQEIYRAHSYALVAIDLWATISSIVRAGDRKRAQCMLALCH
jgi:N-acyl-L-homoserine lactone synthetase